MAGQETVKGKRADLSPRRSRAGFHGRIESLPTFDFPPCELKTRATLSPLTETSLNLPDFPFHCTFDKRLRHRHTPIPSLRNRPV